MIALKEYRVKKGYTQTQIAEALGVTPVCITQWESGVRRPNVVMLKKLAELLGCTADDLLEPIET
ncbi:MAG: helix-turn-helix transcriptional regulator [Clostridia bacterium]|nr:helix-turn-helix transcriptional regulator [Clostridia bacterium]